MYIPRCEILQFQIYQFHQMVLILVSLRRQHKFNLHKFISLMHCHWSQQNIFKKFNPQNVTDRLKVTKIWDQCFIIDHNLTAKWTKIWEHMHCHWSQLNIFKYFYYKKE